ncbi:molybdopterin dinucleotide binding domain protein [Polystyrenella longa]|uniref:Molybdopterin dinucleotide binding domain protein n=2 Tax=Polystyrenella longa TaxID=2528007 RepID=A0A518CTJ4_9PLAN|nr:molybdopterin dinucleotide binding domain protein [Polystyrenella longa]
MEVHPQDAEPLGIESGDYVRLWSDDILIQTGGFQHIEPGSFSFTRLMDDGHIRVGSGEVEAIAIITDAVKPRLLFANFLYGTRTANSLIHRVPDPVTNRYRFKIGKAKVERLRESPYRKDILLLTFKSRTYAGPEK